MRQGSLGDYHTRTFSSRTKRGLRFGEELGRIGQKYTWVRRLAGKSEETGVYKFRENPNFWLLVDKKQKIFKQLLGRELISFKKFLHK